MCGADSTQLSAVRAVCRPRQRPPGREKGATVPSISKVKQEDYPKESFLSKTQWKEKCGALQQEMGRSQGHFPWPKEFKHGLALLAQLQATLRQAFPRNRIAS